MNKKKRIALVWPVITSGDKPAYYNVQAFGLARELCKAGFDVTLFTAFKNNSEKQVLDELKKRANFPYRIKLLPVIKESIRHPIMLGLYKSLSEFDPDLIQVAELSTPATIESFLYSVRMKRKFVIYQGTYKFSNRMRYVQEVAYRTIMFPILTKADLFLTKSTSAKEFLKMLGVADNRIKLVYVGYNRNVLRPKKSYYLQERCKIDRNYNLLLSVGRLVPVKNHNVMLDVIKYLVPRYPKIGLVIVGNGPELPSLMRRVRKELLDQNVWFLTEKIPHDLMVEVYGSAKIYLSPSLYEIFGMTIIEAMACGLPPIVSATGGMRDIITNGVNGFTVPPNDAAEISRKIVLLLDNNGLYERMKKHSMKTADEYIWEVISRHFISAYESLGVVP